MDKAPINPKMGRAGYPGCSGNEAFAGAERYRACLGADRFLLRETGRPATSFPHTERHLKCVWFDSALRPANLQTRERDTVVVEHPGRWNLEAGPDFLGAALRIEPGRTPGSPDAGLQKRKGGSRAIARRVTGDVEIHISAADWTRHGHSGNRDYDGVRAHVTYFPGYLPEGSLPPGAIQLSLKEALSANSFFSFDAIDLAAYPFCSPAMAAPCSKILAGNAETAGSLLDSAGLERMRRKSERLAAVEQERGLDQVLYEEIMTALGYKRNRRQFRHLAEQMPLEALREESRGSAISAYAILMGLAGLLPSQVRAKWDAETRAFIRRLWDCWWKCRARWQNLALEKSAWDMRGIRPQNHPRRRLMAAALLFTGGTSLAGELGKTPLDNPGEWINRTLRLLRPEAGRECYWTSRLSLQGPPRLSPVALIGGARAAAIISNVIIPFLATNRPQVSETEFLAMLAPEEDNSIIRQTANALLGPDHNPSLYRTGLRQQGLIQMFHDFCLNDRSGCAACPLPEMLKTFTGIRQ